jgi:hypothetical protein
MPWMLTMSIERVHHAWCSTHRKSRVMLGEIRCTETGQKQMKLVTSPPKVLPGGNWP